MGAPWTLETLPYFPLIEIVTEPCIRNIEDASTYAQYIQRIVQNLGISEANLEKGEFKSDVSVSLRKKHSYDLNPRTEIKNLNSFKFMVEALKEEVEVKMEGTAKVSKSGITMNIPVHYTGKHKIVF